MTCTWRGCNNPATMPQVAKDGEIWASLCPTHDNALNEGINPPDPRKLISNWILAQGGADKAAKRMVKG